MEHKEVASRLADRLANLAMEGYNGTVMAVYVLGMQERQTMLYREDKLAQKTEERKVDGERTAKEKQDSE